MNQLKRIRPNSIYTYILLVRLFSPYNTYTQIYVCPEWMLWCIAVLSCDATEESKMWSTYERFSNTNHWFKRHCPNSKCSNINIGLRPSSHGKWRCEFYDVPMDECYRSGVFREWLEIIIEKPITVRCNWCKKGWHAIPWMETQWMIDFTNAQA